MQLVFFIGHAGVGKTTLSEALARKTKAVYIDKDVVGKHYMDKLCAVMGLDPDDRDSTMYQTHFRDIEYQAMLAIATQNLLIGNDVYLIAPFTKEMNNPNWLQQFIKKSGIDKEVLDVRIVHVFVEKEVQKDRITKRNEPRDRWKLEHWATYEETLKKTVIVKWDLPAKQVIHFNNDKQLSEDIVNELYALIHH